MRARVLVPVLCALAWLGVGCSTSEPPASTVADRTTHVIPTNPVVSQNNSQTAASPARSSSTRPESVPPPTLINAAAARAQLATLAVKGRAPKTDYSRAKFGRAWDDAVTVAGGRNRCNTRDDILKRDLVDITFRPGGCKVDRGTLHDAYTGRTVSFLRGQRTSILVQIDHLVPLADAWQKGAQQWAADKRLNFANDPRNLQAVDGQANQSKKAGDAATWLPPNKSYRCTYVARQIDVKAAYGLWVTQAERDAMKRVLDGCH